MGDSAPGGYIVDADFLIHLRERYPPDLFPDVWSKLTEMALAGRVVVPREVKREIQKKSDQASSWLRENDGYLGDPDENATFLVASQTPGLGELIDLDGTDPQGDAFVVAAAKRLGLTAVSDETRKGGAKKIPKLCERLDVRCIDTIGLFRAEKLRFRMA